MTDIIYEFLPEDQRKPVLTTMAEVKFGRVFTDHMYIQEYKNGSWLPGKISKLDNLSLHPGSLVLHYAQEIFEGAKCYKQNNGALALFRIDQNIKRFNNSARVLCMPQVDPVLFDKALRELIKVDARHVPTEPNCALYIRPFMIGDDPGIGVRPSSHYTFVIILSPVGAYYPSGFKPASIFSSNEYIRVANYSTGEAKSGNNYAASLLGSEVAHKHGCSQYLWLDSVHRKYVEEVGTMNCFFVKNGIVYTTPLTGSILPGVTRSSVIELCKSENIPLKEEALSIDDVVESIDNGTLTEVFGSGTAASICPVSDIVFKEKKHIISEGKVGPITEKIYNLLVGIQWGTIKDTRGWITYVNL